MRFFSKLEHLLLLYGLQKRENDASLLPRVYFMYLRIDTKFHYSNE